MLIVYIDSNILPSETHFKSPLLTNKSLLRNKSLSTFMHKQPSLNAFDTHSDEVVGDKHSITAFSDTDFPQSEDNLSSQVEPSSIGSRLCDDRNTSGGGKGRGVERSLSVTFDPALQKKNVDFGEACDDININLSKETTINSTTNKNNINNNINNNTTTNNNNKSSTRQLTNTRSSRDPFNCVTSSSSNIGALEEACVPSGVAGKVGGRGKQEGSITTPDGISLNKAKKPAKKDKGVKRKNEEVDRKSKKSKVDEEVTDSLDKNLTCAEGSSANKRTAPSYAARQATAPKQTNSSTSNDNFVRLNMKSKRYRRKGGGLSTQAVRKQAWKHKMGLKFGKWASSGDRGGPSGGRGAGKGACFKCGAQGHWSNKCPGAGGCSSLHPLNLISQVVAD